MEDLHQRRAISVREAASLLGLGRSTIYQLVRSGELRSIRLGRRLPVPLAALDELGFGACTPPDESSVGMPVSST